MMRKELRGLLAIAALVFAGGFTSTAMAQPIFDFEVVGGWVDDRPNGDATSRDGVGGPVLTNGDGLEFSNDTGVNDNGFDTYFDLAWEAGNPTQSALNFNPLSGSVQTGAGPEDTSITTHFNRIIGADDVTLNTVRLFNILTLTDPDDNSVVFQDSINFLVDFDETQNTATVLGCGPLQQSTTPCDDVFTLNGGTFPVTAPFSFEGDNYQLSISLLGLDDQGRLITEEDATNEFRSQIRITEVPAPATVALLGLGLFVLGMIGLRRQSGEF